MCGIQYGITYVNTIFGWGTIMDYHMEVDMYHMLIDGMWQWLHSTEIEWPA